MIIAYNDIYSGALSYDNICKYNNGGFVHIGDSQYNCRNNLSKGFKNNCYYIWCENKITKISATTGKVSELPINSFSENVDNEYIMDLSRVSKRMLVVDDNTFIFYDEAFSAFVMLTTNN